MASLSWPPSALAPSLWSREPRPRYRSLRIRRERPVPVRRRSCGVARAACPQRSGGAVAFELGEALARRRELAARVRGESLFVAIVDPAPRAAGAQQLEHAHAARAPLHRHAVDEAEVEPGAGLLAHRLADDDRGAVALVESLEARREVHRVADRRVVEPLGRAD